MSESTKAADGISTPERSVGNFSGVEIAEIRGMIDDANAAIERSQRAMNNLTSSSGATEGEPTEQRAMTQEELDAISDLLERADAINRQAEQVLAQARQWQQSHRQEVVSSGKTEGRIRELGRRVGAAIYGAGMHSTARLDDLFGDPDKPEVDRGDASPTDGSEAESSASRAVRTRAGIVELDPLIPDYTGAHRRQDKPGKHRARYAARLKEGDPAMDTEVARSFGIGDIVRVMRSSGEMEDGWRVIQKLEGNRYKVQLSASDSDKRPLMKNVTAAELASWQAVSQSVEAEQISDDAANERDARSPFVEEFKKFWAEWKARRNYRGKHRPEQVGSESLRARRLVNGLGAASLVGVGVVIYAVTKDTEAVQNIQAYVGDQVSNFAHMFGWGGDSIDGSAATDAATNTLQPVGAPDNIDQPAVAAAAPETGEVTTLLDDQFTPEYSLDAGGDISSGPETTPVDADTLANAASTAELFDGDGATNILTNRGLESALSFLDNYTVQSGDTVWSLSEKFLNDQGNMHPSVYEIDATKDALLPKLQQLGFADKATGWLAKGDIIRTK